MRMKSGCRVFGILFLLLLSVGTVFSQGEERAKRAPDYRANVVLTAHVPIMMTNRIQREAFRGLIATELMANIFTAKNFHIGFGAQYNLFQTRSPNDFKIKNRDILQHHITPGISFGYEARLKNDQRFSFYPNLFVGYSFLEFTNLRYGVDTAFYKGALNRFGASGFMLAPQLSFLMHMDEDFSSVIGFSIGVNFSTYQLRKSHIYLEKIVNGDGVTNDSYFYNVPDNGMTAYFKIGFTFMQKFKKIKNRIPIRD